MIRTLGLAIGDLGTSRVLAIMLQAIAISLAFFALLAGALVWLLSGFDPCNILAFSSCPLGIGGGTIGGIVLAVLAAWFLYPAVAIAVITNFADPIAAAVEERHYPETAKFARRTGAASGLVIGLKSAGRLVLFNLVALPFYLLLLVTGVGPIVLFVIVNGIAFGRDVAELAAARHGDRRSRRTWLKHTRGQQHIVGLLVSVLFLVPFANLVAPVIGIAAGIHLFNVSFWAMNPDKGRVLAQQARAAIR